jgi:uncharacterized phage protein (TIGR02218 family)
MKPISEALRTHLAKEVTTLATCWKLTRRDGVVLGFTSHDKDIACDGILYVASAAFQATAVTSTIGLSADNYDLEGVLSSERISDDDILAGRYDYAEINCFMLNYKEPETGTLHVKTGWLGEVTLSGQQFVAEVRGISDIMERTIGEHFSPTCRALLGDEQCQVDLAPFTVSGTVTQPETVFLFTDAHRTEEAGYFDYGVIRITSGANVGLKREIKQYVDGSFTVFQPWPYALQTGDAYEAVAGCNKHFSTCVSRFNNAINFRGEPHVPGSDTLLQTASTRQ